MPPKSRMNADDRRVLVLDAATHAFAKGGYAGTSTDKVAKLAGVSQPYVVRMFGTKLELFLAVFDRALGRIGEAFASELARAPFDPESEDDWARLGMTYTELMVDRDLLLVMMHGLVAGSVPEIAGASRHCMAVVFQTLRATGATDERVVDFIAQGMLLNVMLAMNAPEHLGENDALAPLTRCAFGEDALGRLTA